MGEWNISLICERREGNRNEFGILDFSLIVYKDCLLGSFGLGRNGLVWVLLLCFIIDWE